MRGVRTQILTYMVWSNLYIAESVSGTEYGVVRMERSRYQHTIQGLVLRDVSRKKNGTVDIAINLGVAKFLLQTWRPFIQRLLIMAGMDVPVSKLYGMKGDLPQSMRHLRLTEFVLFRSCFDVNNS